MQDSLALEIRKTKIRFVGANFLLLFAAIALSIIWNHSIKEELANQAATFVRKGVQSIDMRGVVESLNGIQLSSFDTVTLYWPNGERVITLPPVMDFNEQKASLWRNILFDEIKVNLYHDNEHPDKLATLVFSFNRFGLAHLAVFSWLFAAACLLLLLNGATRKVEDQIRKEIKLKNAESIEEIARKIRHNIRSPLAALRTIFYDETVPQKTLVEQGKVSLTRLEEIVSEIKNDLQPVTKKPSKTKPSFEISKVVREIVEEKKLITKSSEINFAIKGPTPVFCEIPSADLKAMLSNIIDNSIQALGEERKITVALETDEHAICISIADSGHGISSDVLPHVFDKDFTHGKADGTGLGLFYAKRLIEDYQGNIGIDSKKGLGTTVSMILPRLNTPAWHIGEIRLAQVDEVVICDDQKSILSAWQHKFNATPYSRKASYYSETSSLPNPSTQRRLYLLDYDLGDGKETGLSVAKRIGGDAEVILVTGHYDDPEIQNGCTEIGCKLLPKDEISSIQII